MVLIRIQKNIEKSSTELTLNGNNKEMYYYFDIYNYDEIENEYNSLKGTRREKTMEDIAIEKCGFYLPEEASYTKINDAPDTAEKATLVKKAMDAIEKYNKQMDNDYTINSIYNMTSEGNIHYLVNDEEISTPIYFFNKNKIYGPTKPVQLKKIVK